jgi:hypothetical protein
MRAAVAICVFSLLLGSADAALADPCSSGSGKKCVCDPPLVRVCGPKGTYHKTCWCVRPGATNGGSWGGSYGHAEIHKKNVPQTHPTPGTLQRGRFLPGMMRRPGAFMRR